MENTAEKLTVDELIERFATIQNISIEEAKEQVGADTSEEVLQKITDFTIQKIKNTAIKLNRKQRRALEKKYGKGAKLPNYTIQEQQDAINETARKLSYIDLIQKLRALNEKKAKEQDNGEITDETN